jgi:hypothetical protein
VEYDREERNRLVGEQGKYAEEHFIKPYHILEYGLFLIFNSFNIEKKFIMKKLTSIVGSLPKPVWLAPPKNFGLLELEGETYLRENKTFTHFIA